MANVAVSRAGNKAKAAAFFAKVSQFLRESYIEVVKKASWPTWNELKKSTMVVIIAVLIVACYIALWDGLLSRITEPLFPSASR